MKAEQRADLRKVMQDAQRLINRGASPMTTHRSSRSAAGARGRVGTMTSSRERSWLVTFVRTDDRQRAYIAFFSRINTLLAAIKEFPLRNLNPQGQNWHTLTSLQAGGTQTADIICAFVRQDRFRVELYLDDSNTEQNKLRFEALLERKAEYEQQMGEPLEWERLDGRRACRVAIYRKANILSDSENQDVMDWTVKKAVDFYRVFGADFAIPPALF